MDPWLRLLTLNIARGLFIGSLLVALLVGLVWALNPDERPDAEEVVEARRNAAAASEAGGLGAAGAPGAGTEPAPDILLAGAKPPAETVVQVLEAGGGAAAVDRAVATLERLGYDVLAVNPSSIVVEVTTVYWTQGAEAEARALRARDPRFQMVEPNQGLTEAVDLHVLVGPGF